MSERCSGVGFIGPLAPFAEGFRSWLNGHWYAESSAIDQLRLMSHLSRWLAAEGYGCAALSTEVAGDFLRARRAEGYRNFVSPRSLQPLLDYLRGIGAICEPSVPVATTATALLLQRYRQYLTQERCLVAGTIDHYLVVVDRFLQFCLERDVPDLTGVSAELVGDFVMHEASRLTSGSATHAVTPLRSFLGFGQMQGLVTPDLVRAVPPAARRRNAGIPEALSPGQVKRLLASCDRRTAMGRRDHAMLLMLARLGLRAGELAALELDDVDWRSGEIDVPGKGGRRERLPLPEDVGQALVSYLTRARPTTGDRSLFVRFCAPRTGLDSAAVTRMVHAAGDRAGIPVTGAHQLRHTAATQLLRDGASLAEVSQLLRHRRPATTAIYAKVDHTALRTLARPWPGGAR